MRRYKPIQRTANELYEVKCNRCGEGIELDNLYSGFQAYIDPGFESKFFGDGWSQSFDICEQCAYEFVHTFMIPPDNE